MNLKYRQILETCSTIINEYLEIIEKDEEEIIKRIIDDLDKMSLNDVKKLLLPIVRKIWNIELSSGKYLVISWNKYSGYKEKEIITFATLCEKDNIIPFCNLKNGIQYNIGFDSLLGACPKDGATLIEDETRINEYTIGIIDGKAINSYNGATNIITPKQLLHIKENDYNSKHNELILDSRYIEEIGPYEIWEDNFEELKKLGIRNL